MIRSPEAKLAGKVESQDARLTVYLSVSEALKESKERRGRKQAFDQQIVPPRCEATDCS